ncbi:MAG: DNA repair protein RecO [Desulfobacterales bacterium]|nr:DNA repair protein RecO [Desulfobacterales bacterium]
MSFFSTPAILIRRIDYGDADVILTFLSQYYGKVTVIAKHAKKSMKRFLGILELFCVIDMVCTRSKRKEAMPVLKEAELYQHFSNIREDIFKIAYASYWSELIRLWIEEGICQPIIYDLLYHVLLKSHQNTQPVTILNMIFQMRFMQQTGFMPNLSQCSQCGQLTDLIPQAKIMFHLAKGGILCHNCSLNQSNSLFLSKGTLKYLQWMTQVPLEKTERLRLTEQPIKEGNDFLEMFVPFYLARGFNSLKVLQELKKDSIMNRKSKIENRK